MKNNLTSLQIKESSLWYSQVAGLSPNDMDYYIKNKVVTRVDLVQLSKYCYCLKHKKVKWNDKYIKLQDIENAVKNNIPQNLISFNSILGIKSDAYHIQRIIYFINHPKEISNILLFENVHGFDIVDGAHRLMAALYLKLETIKVISLGLNEKIHLLNNKYKNNIKRMLIY